MSPGLRARKKQRQREEIREAAIALFRKRGYHETRVCDIAETVGISEGTFFNYFPTKDDVLREFVFGYVERYAGILRHALVDHDRRVADRLRDLVRVIARLIVRDRVLMQVALPRLFSAQGRLRENELQAYELFAALLRTGQEQGELRTDVHPLQLAEIMTGALQLTVMNWVHDWWGTGARRPLERRLLDVLDVILHGCLPRRQAPRKRARP